MLRQCRSHFHCQKGIYQTEQQMTPWNQESQSECGKGPERRYAVRKVSSPSNRRKRFWSTSMSCKVPFSRKCRKNCEAVELLKKDKSNSDM